MSVEDDGSIYVLETTGSSGRRPLVRRFDDGGRELEAVETAEPTSSQIRIERHLVLGRPSHHWMPIMVDGVPAAPAQQRERGSPVGLGAGWRWWRPAMETRFRVAVVAGRAVKLDLARDEHDAAREDPAGRTVGQRVVLVAGSTTTRLTSSSLSSSAATGSSAASRSTRLTGQRRPRSVVQARRTIVVPARLVPLPSVRRPLRPGGALMLTPRRLAAGFGLAFALAYAGTAAAYRASSRTTATRGSRTNVVHHPRWLGRGARARHEGYQWAGGCWNDNDRDDSPGDPREDPYTGGEGGDCSGFTFQVWREASTRVSQLSAVGIAALRPWPVHGLCVQGRRRRPERHGPEVGPRKDGRARERRPHRVDLRGEPRGSQIIEAKERRTARTSGRGHVGARATAACGGAGWSS